MMPFNTNPGAASRRSARTQKPSFEPGMGDDDIWGISSSPASSKPSPFGDSSSSSTTSSPFGSSPSASPFGAAPSSSPFGSGPSSSPFGASPTSSPFGSSPSSSPFGMAPSPFGQPSQPQQSTPIYEQVAKVAGTQALNFSKAAVSASKSHDVFSMASMSVSATKASLWVSGVSFLLTLASIFVPLLGVFFYVMIGGLVSLGTSLGGFVIFRMLSEGKIKTDPVPEPAPFPEPVEEIDPFGDFGGSDEDEDDDLDDWSEFEDESPEPDTEPEPVIEEVDTEALMSEEITITPGTQTRSWLFEQANKAMPSINPNFNKMKTPPEGGEMWSSIEELLQEAAEVTGTKEENLPELLNVEENDFIVRLTITRTPGLKVDKVGTEMANLYSRDESGEIVVDKCFAVTTEFGKKATITIYKGTEGVMVSIKDMYPDVKDKVLDTKNLMPIVLGTSAEGKVHFVTLEKMTSLVISGQPRMGKSWVTKSILNQIATYCSPHEAEFWIGDPKDGISDYVDYELPHVRRREFEPARIIRMMHEIVYNVGDERKKIFNKAGCKEIFDFRKKNPDVDMPFIYLVLDEMMTLAGSFSSKEDKDEYDDLMAKLVSQLPALGIRGIFISHRVKDNIIRKNVSELIPCRITVGASVDEIPDNLGIKSFPYTLSTVGDMGMKIQGLQNSTPVFSHAAVIAADADGLLAYEKYIAHIWSKLTPDVKPESASREIPVVDHRPLSKKVSEVTAVTAHNAPPSLQDDFWGESSTSSVEEPDDDFWASLG